MQKASKHRDLLESPEPVKRLSATALLTSLILCICVLSSFRAFSMAGNDDGPLMPKAQNGPEIQVHGEGKGFGNAVHSGMYFRDVASQAGLTTVPHSRTDRRYVLDTMAGGGIALFDCDNDGKLDIAVVNDSTIERYLAGGDLMITLYHQDANSPALHFTDITES